MLIPCSAKIGELAIASPSRPAPTSTMLCWPWVRRILRISPSSAVDVVADAALAELPEGGEIAADLRRVDVRVVRDLLRGDPVLAHLLRLGQNLEVAAEPGGHADEPSTAIVPERFVTPHKDSASCGSACVSVQSPHVRDFVPAGKPCSPVGPASRSYHDVGQPQSPGSATDDACDEPFGGTHRAARST